MADASTKTGSTQIETLARAWAGAGRVVVLTGAGISTDSGIPDFRGPQGVWTKDPKAERMATIHHYLRDPEVRAGAWQARLVHPGWTASPNPAHAALARLEQLGKIQTLVTQNVDGLHALAGSSPEIVVEIHGTMRDAICVSCGERTPMQETLDRVRSGESDPSCHSCGGILKSATILFGQNLDPELLHRARRAAQTADLFVAAGTSLTVFPVARLPEIARSAGGRVAILNAQPTPYDDVADWVVNEPLSEALPRIADLVPAVLGASRVSPR